MCCAFKYLCSSYKIVKEYERAVILRLGRLTSRKAKGPGLFFVLPCVDSVQTVDLRTVTLDVPPQEVSESSFLKKHFRQIHTQTCSHTHTDPYQRQCDCSC